MAEQWLQAMHSTHGLAYTTGQLERGEDGTLHLQYFVMLPKDKAKRITAMKKMCKHTHWTPVNTKDSAWQYCHKEETRVEGPWEFGERPLRQNVKGESAQARA